MRTAGRVKRAVLGIAGGTAATQVLTIAASPILTRFYVPSDFGIAAAFASFIGFFVVISTLRYEYALSVQSEDKDALDVFSLCLTVLFATLSLATLAMLLFRDSLESRFFHDSTTLCLILLPIGFAGAGLYNLFSFWALRLKEYGRVARTKVAQGVGALIIQLGLGVTVAGPVGLLLGRVVGLSAGISTLAKSLSGKAKAYRGFSWSTIRSLAAEHRDLAIYSTPGALFNSIARLSPVLFLAALFDPIIAGLFALADRVTRLPMVLIGNSIAQVYLGEAANKVGEERIDAVYRLFKKATLMLSALAVLPLIVLVFFGPAIFSFVFGKKWLLAGVFAQYMAPQLAVRFVVAPFIQTLLMLNKRKMQFAWEVLNVGLILVVFYLTNEFGIQAASAVGLLSIAGVCSYALIGMVVFVELRKQANTVV